MALLVMLAAAALWAVPVWLDLQGRTIGVSGDPSQYIWDLGWFHHALVARLNPLLTHYLNHPSGINLMWNTSAPLIGILAAPLTALVGPIAALNLMVPLLMALSGWCAYLAARHFGAGVAASAIAGLAFEFSPYELAQGQAHLSTVAAGFAPLLAILLDEALVRRRRPAWAVGVAAGALGVVQLLVLEEYLATAALVCLISALVLAAAARSRVRRAASYVATVFGAAAATFLVLAAYPLAVQFAGPHRPASGTVFHEPGRFVTDLANLVTPTRVELLGFPSVPFTGTLYEFDAYIGLPLLVLLGWFLVTRRNDARARVIALVTAAVLILSLGPQLHVLGVQTGLPLPWLPLDRMPLLDAALPARLAIFADAGVVILLALAIDALVLRPGRWRPVATALLAASLVSWLPAPPPTFAQPVPPFFAAGAGGVPAGSVLLVTPWPREGLSPGMVWQAVSGMRFKLVGGYFLYADAHGREFVGSPPTPLQAAVVGIENGRRTGALTPGERAVLVGELRRDGVDAVAVGESTWHADRMAAFFDALLGRPGQAEGGVLLWTGLR